MQLKGNQKKYVQKLKAHMLCRGFSYTAYTASAWNNNNDSLNFNLKIK